jgi:hypothetical protein
MTLRDLLERVERAELASDLYAAFWARNGGGEPAWDGQADAIRKMWIGIATDALSLIAAKIEQETANG